MAENYAESVPLMPGAVRVVHRAAEMWPVGLASSSPRPLIDLVLSVTGLRTAFAATVSTEEVGRGKPAPAVYLAAAERLDVHPRRCVAVEDSGNGLRAARAAGMVVVALPHPRYPPEPEALAAADLVIAGLDELTLATVGALLAGRS
jgi:HAD superfamily hydrolase (TIGR01509 family)